MKIDLRRFYFLGSAVTLLAASVSAQPYYPPPMYYPGANPPYSEPGPYWPGRETWMPPREAYPPPAVYWQPPSYPGRGFPPPEEQDWRAEPPPWERPAPRRYPGVWMPPVNPYTGGYGAAPWTVPMPQQLGPPPAPGYNSQVYPYPMRGFSSHKSPFSNICH